MTRRGILPNRTSDGTPWPLVLGRLRLLATALERTPQLGDVSTNRAATVAEGVARVVRLEDRAEVWLALSVLSGTLPDDRTVTEVWRRAQLDGPGSLVEAAIASSTTETLRRPLKVVQGTLVVDIHHTARTQLATGIQRVARETAMRWSRSRSCTLVAWLDDFRGLRELTRSERDRMGTSDFTGEGTELDVRLGDEAIIVPWRSTYVVPELVADRPRNQRLLALARWSGNRTGLVGFDTIPITSGDTSDDRVPDFFADHLATARHVDKIAAISQAAATEYRGWRTMLAAVGLPGPDIRPVALPAEVPEVDAAALARARDRFVVAGMPLVLCVGTHEPRKNHGAVLHAARTLWREGIRFSLTFVGGHSWRGEPFMADLRRAQDAGHPVESVSGASDELLWAAYRLARCTVFPSFNEGFGLPVAESLAVGTPALTSAYGSMAEIAADGGALLVDPRDDESVTNGLRALLTDEVLYAQLCAAAGSRPQRTWDAYAAESLEYLVDD